MKAKDIAKDIQKFIGYFLAYWMAFTLVPGLYGGSNDEATLFFVAFGFGLIISVLPMIVGFLKLPEDNPILMFLFGVIVTSIYTYILKEGILGFVYFSKEANLQKLLPFMPDFDEFGIILFVSIVAVAIVTVLNLKIKK